MDPTPASILQLCRAGGKPAQGGLPRTLQPTNPPAARTGARARIVLDRVRTAPYRATGRRPLLLEERL